MLDLKGQRFGKLTVMEFCKIDKHGRYLWKCRCDCGRETTGQTRYLRNGSKVSCGCKRKEQGNRHQGWKGCGELGLNQCGLIKLGADRRHIEFSLTPKYLWDLFLKQEKKCAISGEPIFLNRNRKIRGTASLDRIDSSKGYIEGNVQWVHKYVNIMKWKCSMDEFKMWIDKIYKNFVILNGNNHITSYNETNHN